MGDMTVDELKDKKLWFLWSAKPGGNGKVTKVSFAANGGATGTDDAHRGTWVSRNCCRDGCLQTLKPCLPMSMTR